MYPSPNIVRVIKSRRLKWTGYIARMEEDRSAFKILTDKPTGKIPLGRPKSRWKDNIRIDIKDIGVNTRNWDGTARDRDIRSNLMNAVLNFGVQ